ncbi:hypothetical protein [Alkalihalobacterium bogoriense]
MTIKIIEREASHIIGMQLETLLQDTREQQIILNSNNPLIKE